MIVFSDLHLNADSAEVCLGQVLPGIFDATKQHGDKRVIFLGDFWHVRYRVVVRLQVAVRDELRRWGAEGIDLHILPGNHDQVNVDGRNALEVFDDLPNVVVYTEATADKYGLWLPYRKAGDWGAVIREWREQKKGPRVIFAHHGIRGAMMNDHHQDTTGLPLAMFSKSETVLMGHYHKRQQVGEYPIWYVGSPRQVTAHEAGQPKGYALWDGKRLSWVDTHWGPRFHRLQLKKGQPLDLAGVQPGDDVRVRVADEADCTRISRELDGLNVQHTVTPEVKPPEVRLAVDAGAGLDEFAAAYVALNHGDFNEESLMSLYRGLRCQA